MELYDMIFGEQTINFGWMKDVATGTWILLLNQALVIRIGLCLRMIIEVNPVIICVEVLLHFQFVRSKAQ